MQDSFYVRPRQHPAVGLPERLEASLECESHMILSQLDASDERYNEIPPVYTAALPLDAEGHNRDAAGSFGYPSVIYKVIDRRSGVAYALRRVDGARLSHKAVAAAQARWRSIRHPYIVALHRAFIHAGALYFVHDYVPMAQSLLDLYFGASCSSGPVAEEELWTCLVQLVASIRAVHGARAACRSLRLSRILVRGERVYLGSVGVSDVLDAGDDDEARRQDLAALGLIMHAMAIRSIPPSENNSFEAGMNYVANIYSREFHAILSRLLSSNNNSPPLDVYSLSELLSGRAFEELSRVSSLNQSYEMYLASEVGAGRALRVLLNLATVSFGSTTLSCHLYRHQRLLSLFRDYVFAQVDDYGRPVQSYSHVLACLAKLDASDKFDQLLLMSQDLRVLIVSSFFEIRCVLTEAYNVLLLQGTSSAGPNLSNQQQQQQQQMMMMSDQQLSF